ncbi:hypothetical protein [Haliscomenobacter hydrossis]|uniref:Uncharacterized protein n=1 Tax=Haliscomenobacter hydrossis (strain ATCC 27775 / DSM 1100 / LMG 10767 / O) TaxID=760192 RepID=F4L4B1_HALH1|nr:hypothetical protein [Haliscomenobacter hydrossis]AEE51780.1 hypothetical protein Halhy_3932 [Haliscomenobacter hydrossis DSM 1100]
MRKIYLTVDINVNDDFFKEMTGLEKLNFGDILMDADYKDVWYDRGKIVADTILKTQADILIGYAVQTPKDIESLLKKISLNGLFISSVYLGNRKRWDAILAEYQKKYKDHTNWLHYTPEDIAEMYDKNLAELKEELTLNNILIVFI